MPDRDKGGAAAVNTNPFCGDYMCNFNRDGICAIADLVHHQAQFGSSSRFGRNVWPRQSWQGLIERSRKALPDCKDPEDLKAALKVEPEYEEDMENSEPTEDL